MQPIEQEDHGGFPVIYLQAEDQRYDPAIKEIFVHEETDRGWKGRPTNNTHCPVLTYPKYAWKRVG